MPAGTVKWFNSEKVFDFNRPDSDDADVFVHTSAVERAGLNGLKEDQKISYELVEDRRGRSSAGELRVMS